jgi:hypothetical protein
MLPKEEYIFAVGDASVQDSRRNWTIWICRKALAIEESNSDGFAYGSLPQLPSEEGGQPSDALATVGLLIPKSDDWVN